MPLHLFVQAPSGGEIHSAFCHCTAVEGERHAPAGAFRYVWRTLKEATA